MGSFSGLGIGLSFVFGCILMGLVAEIYYLLWWKKKIAHSNSCSQEFSFLLCWRKPKSCNSNSSSSSSSQELTRAMRSHQETQDSEEGVEAEMKRVHNLCGPPRFLFSIKEESKEDMESADGRSRKGSRTRSLSDLVIGTTPLSSPTLKPPSSFDFYSHHGINPLFEAELSRPRSSPPPKFKFLRDAEEKLLRRLVQEEAEKKMGGGFQDSKLDEKIGSFVDVREQIHNQATQMLPLRPSSPAYQHSV